MGCAAGESEAAERSRAGIPVSRPVRLQTGAFGTENTADRRADTSPDPMNMNDLTNTIRNGAGVAE